MALYSFDENLKKDFLPNSLVDALCQNLFLLKASEKNVVLVRNIKCMSSTNFHLFLDASV